MSSTPAQTDLAVFVAASFGTGFFLLLFWYIIPQAITIFTKRLGRQHAIFGGAYLIWLVIGFSSALFPESSIATHIKAWQYDFVLGFLGISLTLSAASNFGHKNIKNVASGTLDEHATVTYNEMIEHSFYQGLNLVQAMYLHSICIYSDAKYESIRPLLAIACTSPWMIRKYFPVHAFSDNYTKVDPRSTIFVREMYRIKKYQYMFYKHFLLHGLNISVAFSGECLSDQKIFRMYWLLLNAAYVMEFFLQTLVKKGYMPQSAMLTLQVVLMIASSAAAVRVIPYVSVPIALLSLGLNLIARRRDMRNTLLVITAGFILNQY
jgi:hypothetical protein